MGSKRERRAAQATPETDRRLAFLEEARRYAPYLGVEAGGARFLIATDDRGVDRHLFLKQARPEFKVLSRAVAIVEILTGEDAIAGRQLVDVGANIGTTTIHALVSLRFGMAVSCEPHVDSFRLLRANVALNDLDERVRPLRVAVSSAEGAAQLVVLSGRAGAGWIALDRDRIRKARAARAEPADISVVDVETVTLDGLTEAGVIDREQVGMVWIDVEGHEGHVLEGAGRLADRGVPIVFEFHPRGLAERGDSTKVHSVAEQSYTHFVDVRRPQTGRPRFELEPVTELRRLGERLLDTPGPGRFTDVLLMRLDAAQAKAGASLPALLQRRGGVRPARLPLGAGEGAVERQRPQ